MRNVWQKFSGILAATILFSAAAIAQDGNMQQQENKVSDDERNQQYETSAQQLTENLAAKITLRDEQKVDIQEAIYNYYEDAVGKTSNGETDMSTDTDAGRTKTANTEQMEQQLNDEISLILEDSQQAQWEVAKADFWNQVREKVAGFKNNSMY